MQQKINNLEKKNFCFLNPPVPLWRFFAIDPAIFSLKLLSRKFHICRLVFQGEWIYLCFGSVRCFLIALRITISAQRGVRLLERRFWSEPAVKQKITPSSWQSRKFRSRRISNFRIMFAETKFQNRNHGALFSSFQDFNARFRYFDLIKYRQKWHDKN